MTTKNEKASKAENERDGIDEVIKELADVVNTTLGVGATISKAMANATAANQPVPLPKKEGEPLNEMVHYGITTITNVINLAVQSTSFGSGSDVPKPKATAKKDKSPDSTLPTVRRGSTLRMPLSIENPGEEPMTGLTFACLSIKADTDGRGKLLEVGSIRFDPINLNVAPKDFEKLTALLDTAADTALGTYTATIGLGKGVFEMDLTFRVIPLETE